MTAIAPELAAKYDHVMQLEFRATQAKRCLPLAMNVVTAAIGAKADQERLYTAIAGLSDEELRGYADYRRENKWWDFR